VATDAELRRYGFDPARQTVARRHARALRLTGAAGSLTQVAALLLFARFGALPLREALAPHLSGFGLFALFAFVLSLGLFLVAFPAEALAHRVERRYGLSSQTFPSFLADAAKEAILTTAMGTAGLAGIYAAIAILPQPWLVGWAGASLALLLAGFAAPVLIAPLFYRFTPLKDPALSERLRTLAAKAGGASQEPSRWEPRKRRPRRPRTSRGSGGRGGSSSQTRCFAPFRPTRSRR